MATPTKPNSRLGTYVVKTFKDESFQAYVPPPLPPDPPLALQPLLPLLEQANQALGRLDGLASILPDPSLFIYLYVRKEAVLSSQIEGTQSSFSDLMLFESAEAPSVPLEDVQEVSNYVAAMNHGLRRLREGFPLSLRLIREIHKILLSKGRGSQKRRGEFRETQNWIGGTRPGNAAFVPPPPEKMMECMGALSFAWGSGSGNCHHPACRIRRRICSLCRRRLAKPDTRSPEAARHLLEIYRRQLGNEKTRRKLQRLDKRLLIRLQSESPTSSATPVQIPRTNVQKDGCSSSLTAMPQVLSRKWRREATH